MSHARSEDGRLSDATPLSSLDRRPRRRRPGESDLPSENRLIFLCAANVCRSPVMAYGFSHGGPPYLWSVSSGGVSARDSLPMCDEAAALLAQNGVDTDTIESHRAMRVEPAHLDGQDLIITASREERAAVARMRPGLRNRCFTLREAVALGAAVVSQAEVDAASAAVDDGRRVLAVYAAILHHRRGTMPTALAPGGRRLFRAVPDPQDIPDAHHARRRHHSAVVREAWESTQTLQRHVAAFVTAHSAAS